MKTTNLGMDGWPWLLNFPLIGSEGIYKLASTTKWIIDPYVSKQFVAQFLSSSCVKKFHRSDSL